MKKKNPIEKIEEGVVDSVKNEWKIIRRFKKHNEDRLLFAAFVIVISSLVVINTVYVINRVPNNPVKNNHGATIQDPQTVLTSSQTAHTSVFDVSVKNVKEDSTSDKAFAFASNETMLIMKVSITNLSQADKQLIPINQFFVRSRDGTTYNMHPSSYITKQLGSQEIVPGQTVEGDISFAIPKILTSPLLYVDLGWENYSPVVYDVLR